MAEPTGLRAGDLDPILKLANTEAEQSLLGALLLNNAVFEHVVDIVGAGDFANGVHGRIYHAIGELASKGQLANPVTLLHHFANEEALARVGGGAYLARIAASGGIPANAPHYARTIADLARRRDLVSAAQDIILDATTLDDVNRTAADAIDAGEQRLYEIAESATQSVLESVGSIAAGVVRDAEAAYKAGGIRTVDTGIHDLDAPLSGLDAGSLILVGGRPSMGKTAFANTVAFNVARTPPHKDDPPSAQRVPGKVVAFFSLEMTKAQLTQRWLAGLTGIETEDQRHGRVKPDDWTRLIKAQQYLNSLPIYVDDQARLSVPQMRQRARRLKRRVGRLDLIIVDHLQHVRQGGRVENRRLEIGDATGMLKAVAKELNCPVLLLSQLSRAVEQRDDKRPMLADLRESGDIEQDADVVMFLYREEYYLSRSPPRRKLGETREAFSARLIDHESQVDETRGLAEILIPKNRTGRAGVTVKVAWDAPRQRFTDLARS